MILINQHQQQQQSKLDLTVMYEHPSSLTKRILSGVTFQYFIATIIMLINLKKDHIVHYIWDHSSWVIFVTVPAFILTVLALKKNIGGCYGIVNFGLYMLMTAALAWTIAYLCLFYQNEEALNFAAMLFASSLGLRIYASTAKADFSDKFDIYGGLFAISSGIALTISLMSNLYVSFDMFFLFTVVLTMTMSLLLMKAPLLLMSNYPQPELTSVFRLTALLYWSLPVIFYQEVVKICKRNH